MEERDLIKAKSFLAEGFQMEFPGGEIFTELSELVDWGKERYKSITKDYEHFDELSQGHLDEHCKHQLD